MPRHWHLRSAKTEAPRRRLVLQSACMARLLASNLISTASYPRERSRNAPARGSVVWH